MLFRFIGLILIFSSKRTWGLTTRQKARLDKRLEKVDQVVDTLVDSGVSFKKLELAKRMPRANELSDTEKYWVVSKRFPTGYKPISWVPHWTKVAHPRKWEPTIYHAKTVVGSADEAGKKA